MRKTITHLIFVLLAGVALPLAVFQLQPRVQAAAQPAATAQGGQPATVEADGSLRSNQSAQLTWRTSGTVASIPVRAGQMVTAGEELAMLDPASLPRSVLLAQASLVDAQKALDDLLNSNLQKAQAQQAVEDAQQALDDLLHPEAVQAQALQDVASAQEAVDQAELQVYILTTPPAQSVIDQAHANLLLAQKKRDNTSAQLEHMRKQQKKLTQLPVAFRGRLRPIFQKGIENLKTELNRDQMALDKETDKYNELVQPPNPTDVAQAQSDLAVAQAKLAQAQRDYQDLKDGPSPAQLARAHADLADAQREWERLKDGPNPADVAAAQARVAAAQAALGQAYLAAPFAGVITRVANQPGDQVHPGELAFRLDDLSSLLADVYVSEIDINQVQVGQSALLAFDGVPDHAYHGTVTAVAPVGTITDGVTNFTVTIQLADPDTPLHPGMTVSAKIDVS
jgi:HlyD family secretion protein